MLHRLLELWSQLFFSFACVCVFVSLRIKLSKLFVWFMRFEIRVTKTINKQQQQQKIHTNWVSVIYSSRWLGGHSFLTCLSSRHWSLDFLLVPEQKQCQTNNGMNFMIECKRYQIKCSDRSILRRTNRKSVYLLHRMAFKMNLFFSQTAERTREDN